MRTATITDHKYLQVAGGIEKMIEIVLCVESEDIPARFSRNGNHPLANGMKGVDFVEPAHGDSLGRQTIV